MMIYYGVGLNTSDLAGNPFLNYAISISLELIAGIACQFIFSKFGCKKPCIFGLLLTGVSLISTAATPQSKSRKCANAQGRLRLSSICVQVSPAW